MVIVVEDEDPSFWNACKKNKRLGMIFLFVTFDVSVQKKMP